MRLRIPLVRGLPEVTGPERPPLGRSPEVVHLARLDRRRFGNQQVTQALPRFRMRGRKCVAVHFSPAANATRQ